MVSKEFRLDGKKGLIAGNNKFWAKCAAAALAEAGSDIAIAAKSLETLSGAAKEAQQFGKEILTIPTDVTEESQVQSLVNQVIDKFGQIDILVNCSDLRFAKPFVEIKKEEWQRILDTNLNCVFYCCQTVGREMLKQKKGRIINITSCLAERGMANCTAYCTSVGGVLQLTRALALEWARDGITVNAIGTGWMAETEKIGALQEEQLLKYIPLRRYGHPREIGSLLCYLASDAASFLTAEFTYVDGAVMDVL